MVAVSLAVATFVSLTGTPQLNADEAPAPDDPQVARSRQLYDSIRWQTGPCVANIGNNAQINVPAGYQYTGREGAQTWFELTQNPPDSSTLGVLMPESGEWFMIFDFDASGYVKDDDKDKLDAGAILDSVKQGTQQSNQERARHGWAPLEITGWEQPPHYDALTHNLEWAIRATSEGEQILNHNPRILGRRGVMSVNLVVDPAQLTATLPTTKKVLEGFQYVAGERYAEWRTGDKIAEYGLAGLVAGGTAAVLLKTGLLGKFLKPIIIGGAALFGWLGKVLFGRRSRA
jgi:uncharacterized membrane-anchored protein